MREEGERKRRGRGIREEGEEGEGRIGRRGKRRRRRKEDGIQCGTQNMSIMYTYCTPMEGTHVNPFL